MYVGLGWKWVFVVAVDEERVGRWRGSGDGRGSRLEGLLASGEGSRGGGGKVCVWWGLEREAMVEEGEGDTICFQSFVIVVPNNLATFTALTWFSKCHI